MLRHVLLIALLLGGNNTGHHRGEDKTIITIAPGADSHAILKDIKITELIGHGTLYKNTPLATSSMPLLIGTIPKSTLRTRCLDSSLRHKESPHFLHLARSSQ